MMKISDVLKMLIIDHKMSQADIANEINCQQSTISKYLRNQRKQPSFSITARLIKLANRKRIKIKIEDLLG